MNIIKRPFLVPLCEKLTSYEIIKFDALEKRRDCVASASQ